MTVQENEVLFLLRAVDGDQEVTIDRELVMGRDTACDLVLDQGRASRKHARLSPGPDGIVVEDLGSTNGTFVNGQKISEPTVLKEGDELLGGLARFTVVRQEPEDPEMTEAYSVDEALAQAEIPPSAATAPKARDAEPSESKAPPSWVLNNQQSVDGTAFISKDMLQDSMVNTDGKVQNPEDVEEPTLVGNSDPIMGLRFQLIGEDKHKWEIGRSPNVDVMINDDSVSGAHAQILFENGRWKLVDLMSANGTYANGKKCLTGYLASGDVVRFGGVECAFMLPEGSEPEEPEEEMEAPEPPANQLPIKTVAIAFGATVAVIVLVFLVLSLFL